MKEQLKASINEEQTNNISSKPLHRQFFKYLNQNCMDLEKIFGKLRSAELKTEAKYAQ